MKSKDKTDVFDNSKIARSDYKCTKRSTVIAMNVLFMYHKYYLFFRWNCNMNFSS